jgi:hypothetical protein
MVIGPRILRSSFNTSSLGFSKNLKSVVDQKLKFHGRTYCDGSSPFGGVSFCQDLDQHDLFYFRDLGNMLQSVLLLSSKAEPSSIQEMRTKKCREAAVTLKSLEKELKTFPKLKSGAKVALFYMARYQF